MEVIGKIHEGFRKGSDHTEKRGGEKINLKLL
jgi:hypothetical protein